MAVTNVITFAALAIFTNLVSGLGGTVPKYMGIGTNGPNTAAVRAGTALNTETYTTSNTGSQNTRILATLSRTSFGGQTNDTYQLVASAVCPAALAPLAVKEAGIFDAIGTAANLVTAPSGGNMALWSTFDVVNLQSGDTLQITWQLTFS